MMGIASCNPRTDVVKSMLLTSTKILGRNLHSQPSSFQNFQTGVSSQPIIILSRIMMNKVQ